MKLMYLDIETTGLDPDQDQILEIGCVLDDLSNPKRPLNLLPTFHAYLKHERYSGNAIALAMNAEILKKCNQEGDNPKYIAKSMLYWLEKHEVFNNIESLTVAGKNVGAFDYQFLVRLPGFSRDGGRIKINNTRVVFGQRVFDPAPYFYQPGDANLPNLDTCLKRANIPKKTDHTALGDCFLIAELIRFIHNSF